MGGQIKIQSETNKGSKFWFILPIVPKKEVPKTFGEAMNLRPTIDEYEESSGTSEELDGKLDSQKYDSDEEEQENYGLPENFAMTSQILHENILMSFFPGNNVLFQD